MLINIHPCAQGWVDWAAHKVTLALGPLKKKCLKLKQTDQICGSPPAERSDSQPARHHHQPPLRKGTASSSFLSSAFCRALLIFFLLCNLNAAVGYPPQPGSDRNLPAPHPVRHEPFQPGPLCQVLREVKSPRITKRNPKKRKQITKSRVRGGESKSVSLSADGWTWKSRGPSPGATSEP